MASEQTAMNTSLSSPATLLSTTATPGEADNSRTKSLKRSRADQSQNLSNLSSIANASLGPSPSPKSPRFKGTFSPGMTPVPLTGAAALADQRRAEAQRAQNTGMSENPGHKALSSLMAGGGTGMSKAQDAPLATTSLSEGLSAAANAISIPSPMNTDDRPETSPASVTSLASLGSTAPTATANSTVVASPAALTSAIEAEAIVARQGVVGQQAHTDEPTSKRPLTFPGNVLGQADPSRMPARGMSLPMPSQGQQLAPRSPSQKKHKCPYCETEFTRHHNLKSHLLTHSQEKPYVCQTCNMRFRRLHDLKRHTKLHTGERPHICPKCDRKFARGDALARHSKGQGGCAGRRSSMGGFDGDDDYDGSNAGDGEEGGMDGIMYTNGTHHPNENEMSEEDRRRFSLPSIKAQHVSGPGSGDNYSAQSRAPSTYPPAGPRPGGHPSGGLYPPQRDRGGSASSGTSPSMQNSFPRGHTPGSSMSSLPLNTAGGSMFSQSGMTESPKPLSPAGMHSHQLGHDPSSISRQRSPSLTTQFQQQQFGRRQSNRNSPPGMALPSPHSNGPKLPSLPGLAPPDQRFTLSSQNPHQQNANPQQGQSMQGATSPAALYQGGPVRGLSTGPQQPGSGSGDSSNNLFAAGEQGVWSYVQTLEDKVKHLSEKVQVMESERKSQEDKFNRMAEELFAMRNQLNGQNQAQQPASGHS